MLHGSSSQNTAENGSQGVPCGQQINACLADGGKNLLDFPQPSMRLAIKVTDANHLAANLRSGPRLGVAWAQGWTLRHEARRTRTVQNERALNVSSSTAAACAQVKDCQVRLQALAGE